VSARSPSRAALDHVHVHVHVHVHFHVHVHVHEEALSCFLLVILRLS
jgi:hypothetical protein